MTASAQGFTQIILTYTLSAITALLGLSTLWLSCGTLARDIEECQIQVVATKPVARWQIWLGKWLGIVSPERGAAGHFRGLRFWPVAISRLAAAAGGSTDLALGDSRRPRLGQGSQPGGQIEADTEAAFCSANR